MLRYLFVFFILIPQDQLEHYYSDCKYRLKHWPELADESVIYSGNSWCEYYKS